MPQQSAQPLQLTLFTWFALFLFQMIKWICVYTHLGRELVSLCISVVPTTLCLYPSVQIWWWSLLSLTWWRISPWIYTCECACMPTNHLFGFIHSPYPLLQLCVCVCFLCRRCVQIIHKLLCYQKKCRIRLHYTWRELWSGKNTKLFRLKCRW